MQSARSQTSPGQTSNKCIASHPPGSVCIGIVKGPGRAKGMGEKYVETSQEDDNPEPRL